MEKLFNYIRLKSYGLHVKGDCVYIHKRDYDHFLREIYVTPQQREALTTYTYLTDGYIHSLTNCNTLCLIYEDGIGYLYNWREKGLYGEQIFE